MAEMDKQLDGVLIPIVLGVTGHQDISAQDYPALRAKVREVLLEIKSRHVNSPVILLSPLAEGADRLAAQEAIGCGIDLIVPLPMEIDEYEKDFRDKESRDEFRRLLKLARTSHVVTASGKPASGPADSARENWYASLGAYIANQCQILIALWDGAETELTGGTSEIVRYKLEGVPDIFSHRLQRLRHIESGPVYHILTPRITNPASQHQSPALRKLFPRYWGDPGQAEAVYRQILDSIDAFNRDVAKNRSVLDEESPSSRSNILEADSVDGGIDHQPMLNKYVAADVLANLFKSYRIRTILWLISLIIIAFLFFQIYLEFGRNPTVLLAYPLLLGIAGLVYWAAKRRRFDLKHEDYRALAEAMRVQYFWHMAGIEENVADHYLRKHKGELEWIRYAIRGWSLSNIFPDAVQTSVEAAGFRLTIHHWVEHQRRWFERRSSQDQGSVERLEKWGNSLFFIGVAAALGILALHYTGMHVEFFYSFLLVLVAMALTLSGAIHGYVEKMVLSEQSKQYHRMATLYAMGMNQLDELSRSGNSEDVREILFELGKEALVENGDWLLLHRSRPLEMPKAG